MRAEGNSAKRGSLAIRRISARSTSLNAWAARDGRRAAPAISALAALTAVPVLQGTQGDASPSAHAPISRTRRYELLPPHERSVGDLSGKSFVPAR